MDRFRASLLPLLLTGGLAVAENPQVALLAKAGHWQPEAWPVHGAMLGKPAPPLDLQGWAAGELGPEARQGKIVVVDFWATWCAPCVQAIPHNSALARRYADRGVRVLGACGSGQGEEKMAYYAQLFQFAYPTARVSPASTAAWQVKWWPTYAIIDRHGILRALGLRPDHVEKVLEALLLEQPGP